MKTVKILKKEAEKVRQLLISLDMIHNGYIPETDKDHLFIPIKKVTEEIKNKFNIVEKELKKLVKEETKLIDVLKKELKEELHSLIPSSFEIIGDIAIIEIPKKLESKEKLIGESLLKIQKNIKVVAKKAGQYEGEFRTRKLKIIAGENRKETIHKENNSRLKLNVETCYFSPRLSTERRRIIDMINPDEEILVMFSGIGPYPITIARNTEAKEIVGIEINPNAHKYAEENIKLNKVKNVILYNGDVRDIVPKLKKKFDRIIMPLPKTADEFLPTVLDISRPGTIVHIYDFLHESEIPNLAIEKVKNYIPKANIKEVVKCGQYSPGKFRICVDFEI